MSFHFIECIMKRFTLLFVYFFSSCFWEYIYAENAFENCRLYNHRINALTQIVISDSVEEIRKRKYKQTESEKEEETHKHTQRVNCCWKQLSSRLMRWLWANLFRIGFNNTKTEKKKSELIFWAWNSSLTFSLSSINAIIWMVLFFTTFFFVFFIHFTAFNFHCICGAVH